MVVYFHSQPVLQDEDLQSIETYDELLETLAAATTIPRSKIKLISNGKVLSSNFPDTLNLSSKIIMIGSSAAVTFPDSSTLPSSRVHDDLLTDGVQSESHRSASSEKYDRRMRSRTELSNPYRFHDLETLSGLPDETKAKELLRLLSTDPGVLAVLKQHKWSVGKLCEMYPEGYVGVSDVCILGLNENKGQKIFLRLRTDDLKGFRKLLTIKKILYHELAHNEHSDHNDQFYLLMRQIEREVVELDWRQSTRGHVLGVGRDGYDSESTSEDKSGGVIQLAEGGTAGGDGSDSNGTVKLSSSSLKHICPCGCVSHLPDSMCFVSSPPLAPCVTPASSIAPIEELHSIQEEGSGQVEKDTASDVNEQASEKEEAAAFMDLLSVQILSTIDETLTSFYLTQQEPPERVILLREAMCDFLSAMGQHSRLGEEVRQRSIAQLLETLTLLRDIIARAKDSDDPKYQSLNRTKKLFQRVLVETRAVPVLIAAGFVDQVGSDHLHLTRNDPAILYMFVDILNSIIEVSKEVLARFVFST